MFIAVEDLLNATMADTINEFIANLPKLELHAHLNGSLSNEALDKLSHLKNGLCAQNTGQYSCSTKLAVVTDAFEKFKYAHELTGTKEAVELATKCVIEDFAMDKVVYAELRTTPRSTSNMSKDDYLSAVIRAIEVSKTDVPNILVKLLVSINRRESLESGAENVNLAIKYRKLYPNIICGVDLSGDPTCKEFGDFQSMLTIARENGLKLALHCGEIDNENEITEMLTFGMDRLGHGIFVKEENEEKLLNTKLITLECCLTSNLYCGYISHYEDHHFERFFKNGHPVVICTDDFGVFNTSLSKEFKIVSSTFGLSNTNLVDLCITAVDASFASDDEKIMLKQQVIAYAENEKA